MLILVQSHPSHPYVYNYHFDLNKSKPAVFYVQPYLFLNSQWRQSAENVIFKLVYLGQEINWEYLWLVSVPDTTW